MLGTIGAAAAILAVALPGGAATHHAATPHSIAPPSSTTPMTRQMHALRGEVQQLHAQMERIERSTDRAQRRQLMQEHLVSLTATLSKLHAMELQMIDDVKKGRVVSDSDLASRQRLLAEQTAMLLEMLEQAIKATGSAAQ
ncbi:MAG TPA: hypothetical protein VFR86_15305 [Burkholderiaceae bacterium]|nr:hypothetical protein [Burkholderiaceae bacterium]